jgi:hypothetical protein
MAFLIMESVVLMQNISSYLYEVRALRAPARTVLMTAAACRLRDCSSCIALFDDALTRRLTLEAGTLQARLKLMR